MTLTAVTAKYIMVAYVRTGSYAPGVLREEYKDGMQEYKNSK